jgi:PTH1 family peptidyl-tRNA hydrolase
MKLIVGLGNPGLDYKSNRHNTGFAAINIFAKQHSITFDKKQGKARVGAGSIGNIQIVLARPQTYMNSSGDAVEYLVNRYKIDLKDLIVIHDDLDLPLGKLRIRLNGGSGGHNGVESIINELGSPDFIRVRIGIGRPEVESPYSRGEVVDYVLGDLTEEENRTLIRAFSRANEALECLVIAGLEAAMNKYNRDTDASSIHTEKSTDR